MPVRLRPRLLIIKGADHMSKITVDEALANAGHAHILEVADDATVPACCSEGCMVEPDGTCPHGHDSVLIEEGLI